MGLLLEVNMKKGLLIIPVIILAITMNVSAGGTSEKKDTFKEEGVTYRHFATIGTGSVTGVYYSAGESISKMVNKKIDIYGQKVTVESTDGSVFNINAVMDGDLEFGIVQSDRQTQAWAGTDKWKEAGPQKDLRAICALYPESVTLIAAVDANINSIEDLKGKVVSIGNPGSSNRGNAIIALENAGLNWETDIKAESLKASETAKMLQDGHIDAFFYTVGHPNDSFKEATAGKRKVKFIPITNIDRLLEKYPYYTKSVIPVEFYPNAAYTEDVETFGVKAILITSASVHDDIVYAVTKEIFDNLDEFKALHPAFDVLTKENMMRGLTVPFHPVALKYFTEAGLK